MRGLWTVVAALAFGSCALGDDRVDRTCSNNDDCFTAQGETCNTTTKLCELATDAGALVEDEEPVDESPEVSR